MADEQVELTPREKLQQARMDRVQKAVEVGRVRVTPRDDVMRAVLKHPRGGGFRSVGDIEWPNDRFTQRRIEEGAVTISKPDDAASKETPAQPQPAPPVQPAQSYASATGAAAGGEDN